MIPEKSLQLYCRFKTLSTYSYLSITQFLVLVGRNRIVRLFSIFFLNFCQRFPENALKKLLGWIWRVKRFVIRCIFQFFRTTVTNGRRVNCFFNVSLLSIFPETKISWLIYESCCYHECGNTTATGIASVQESGLYWLFCCFNYINDFPYLRVTRIHFSN